MRIIATRTDTVGDIELVEEQEVITVNEELMCILLSWGWAKPYDDTKPLPPKGLGVYESKSYPEGRFVVRAGNLYISKVFTNSTWAPGEWDEVIKGRLYGR